MDNDVHDEEVPPYDAFDRRNEGPPDHVVYLPVHQNLEASFGEVAEMLDSVLRNTPYKGAVVQSLRQEIARRTTTKQSDDVMFAVTGNMASGKSSVINSILSSGMLARKGASGGSCTWVVQRFRKMFPGQESPFAAEVHFFNQAEIRDILKAHLDKYYNASRKPTATEDGDEDGDDESDDFNDISTVLEAFIPLFGHKMEFGDFERARNFLDRATNNEGEASMLERLMLWANEGIHNELDGETCLKLNATTAGALLSMLNQFTTTIKGVEGEGLCQPWLLVKVVDFGLDIPILNRGFIFVDSPGTSDANSTRAANARAYHRKCSHRIYVANVSRAVDDKSLREAMVSSHRARGSRTTVLVLTHGDNIDEETVVHGTKFQKQREQTLKEELKALVAERSSIKSKRQRTSTDGQSAFNERAQVIQEKIQKVDQDLKLCRLKMRNNDTIMTLQRKYKEQSGDPHLLPVFVVDNEQYKIHQAGYAPWLQQPHLDVEETGIPALRKQIYLLPAEGKLNETLHVAYHQIPTGLSAVRMYYGKNNLELEGALETLVLQLSASAPMIVDQLKSMLQAALRAVLLGQMTNDEQRWIEAARELCHGWGMKYPKIFRALLKTRGFRKGKKGAKNIDWQTELLDINKSAMKVYFAELQHESKACFGSIWMEVVRLFDDLRTGIKSKLSPTVHRPFH